MLPDRLATPESQELIFIPDPETTHPLSSAPTPLCLQVFQDHNAIVSLSETVGSTHLES